MILALDTSRFTGWAIGPPGATPLWGVEDLGRQSLSTGQVIVNMRRLLWRLFQAHRPTLVCFEAPYLPRPGGRVAINALTIRRLMGLAATVEGFCVELGVECREATPVEIAKFFLGKSRPLKREGKKLATMEMCRQYGWAVDNDNCADALALWAMAEATIDPAATARRGEGPLFLKTNRPGGISSEAAIGTTTSPRGQTNGERDSRYSQLLPRAQ